MHGMVPMKDFIKLEGLRTVIMFAGFIAVMFPLWNLFGTVDVKGKTEKAAGWLPSCTCNDLSAAFWPLPVKLVTMRMESAVVG